MTPGLMVRYGTAKSLDQDGARGSGPVGPLDVTSEVGIGTLESKNTFKSAFGALAKQLTGWIFTWKILFMRILDLK